MSDNIKSVSSCRLCLINHERIGALSADVQKLTQIINSFMSRETDRALDQLHSEYPQNDTERLSIYDANCYKDSNFKENEHPINNKLSKSVEKSNSTRSQDNEESENAEETIVCNLKNDQENKIDTTVEICKAIASECDENKLDSIQKNNLHNKIDTAESCYDTPSEHDENKRELIQKNDQENKIDDTASSCNDTASEYDENKHNFSHKNVPVNEFNVTIESSNGLAGSHTEKPNDSDYSEYV